MRQKFLEEACRGWKVLMVGLLIGLAAVPAAAEYDECDARFIAFLGSDAYQFSPRLPDELGKVRLYSVLSYQRAAATQDYGRAFWRLEIRGPVGRALRLVSAAEGSVRIDAAGQAVAEVFWDGRDEKGRLVPAGMYQYTFLGRFAPDRLFQDKIVLGYGDLDGAAGVDEAAASTFDVIVDYRMTADAATRLRMSKALGSCQTQQNTPIEAGFGYNFYYGSTHSHSNYSDGGHPTSACSSGNAYGSGTFDPAAVYDYARNSAGLDFWVINEHNHLINDSVATNNAPVTEAKVRQRYAAGLAAANAATVNGVFIGIYGMEWGVTTNADQGHVTLLETPRLLGWETCSTCNGPSAECTPGTNCYFDVFTPKRFGYLTLYRRSVENPSPAGALGILCHPSTGEFDNYAFNSDADQALQGIAVRSGLAFNTATNCADANVASTDYTPRWREALNKGFHLGPVADHDAHCNNFGVGIPNRTVYLLPNGASPALTKTALLQAHKARHFFATEDSNAQLVFATSDGGRVMGDIFSAAGSATLRAAVYDPGNEAVTTLEIWRGQIGGGVPAAAYRTVSNQSSLTLTETLTSGTYYYYVRAVQSDGHDIWSAPMWITYGPGGGGGASVDVSGWRLSQLNSTNNYTIPAGTVIPAGGYLIVGRNASKAAFEAFWRGGTPLPANVLYLNSGDTMPVINGSETYDLYNAAGTRIDGRTIAMATSGGNSVQRKDPCNSPSVSASWTIVASSSGNPGSGAGAGCAKGVVINEFSDAVGTGNFIYEFIELHNDQ
ncbi:MAG TPA: lamin tail domain-containing protein [Thermoanaerobaculia bacterium]